MTLRNKLRPLAQYALWPCLAAMAATVGAPAFGDDPGLVPPPAATPESPGAPESGLAYRTKLLGIKDQGLRSLLQETLDQAATTRRAPETLVDIDRRTQRHVEALTTVLRSEGYYDSATSYRIDEQQTPIQVFIEVEPGPRYVIKQYVIEYEGPGAAEAALPRTLAPLGLELGVPARSEFVLQVQDLLLRRLGNLGRPLAKVIDRRAVVDHADHTMSVTLRIAPGEAARFGPVTVEPLPTVDEDYVRGFISWKTGDVYRRSKVDGFRRDLLDTGLFESVAIEWPRELNAEGELPITVRLSEAKHRSVGFQGHWSTDEGFGVETFWEHRNLFGRQELLTLTARIEEIRREFDLSFRKPRYLRKNQTLLVDAVGGYQETDAYSGPLATAFAGLERRLGEAWTVSAGLRAEASNLDDFQGTRDFNLAGLSIRGVRDTSDDRLDPTRGTRLHLSLTPYYGSGDAQLGFVEADILGTAYYSLLPDRRAVLAARAKLGAITGEESASLPANRRFYAGGGASIRGYALQSVGPLNADNTPLGGRSLVELGAELRIKLTETLGGVAFIEGGNVFDDPTPDPFRSLRWAVGFGARYFTAVGPIRLDFGFPLNRRPIDDSFQFYISVGQAY